MRLLLKFMPARSGDADEAQLVREHDEDLREGDEISLPAPLGVLRVATRDVRHLAAVRLSDGRSLELIVDPANPDR